MAAPPVGRPEGLALGAVGFELIEGTFYALDAVSVLLLLTLNQESVATALRDRSPCFSLSVRRMSSRLQTTSE